MTEHFWVHVLSDYEQTEWRFSEEPDGVLSLHVWTDGRREWTVTRDASWFCEGCLLDVRIPRSDWKHRDDCTGFKSDAVTPPGNGWRRCRKPPFMQLQSDQPSTVWYRKAVRS
jgi:hypothetical protein